MKFINCQIQVADLMEEKSKLRFGFLYRQTAVHQRKKNLKDNPREMSDY